MMLMVADKFQFKAVEIEGDVYATAAELASTMGISPRGIRKLLRKYDIHGWNITSEPVVPRSVHERLGLKTRDSSTLLFGWEALLVIGFTGTLSARQRLPHGHTARRGAYALQEDGTRPTVE